MALTAAKGAAAALLLATGLTACGSGADSDAGGSIGQPGEKITGDLTFWHAYSADSPELKTMDEVLIPRFEEMHPGVDVKSVPVPYDDLHQKLVTAAAGAALPDMVRSDIIWVPELADLGVLVPLDEAMPDFDELAGQVYEGPLATNLWHDHYYGLPLDTNTRVMLFNQKTLDAAGVESPPTSFEELSADATKLQEAGAFAFADNDTQGWNVLPWIWSAGGEITDEEQTKATGYLNSPESVAGIQFLVDLYQDGHIPDLILGAEGGTATSDGLPAGEYATILDGPWMWPIFESQFPDFEVQAAPMPAGDGGSVSVVGGESVVLTQSSENKAAAAEFMRFLLSEESQVEMAKVGQMSVLSSLADRLPQIHDYYTPFVEQIETARPRPPTPAWPKVEQVLQQKVQLALRGELSVQDALDQAAAEIDELLAPYNS